MQKVKRFEFFKFNINYEFPTLTTLNFTQNIIRMYFTLISLHALLFSFFVWQYCKREADYEFFMHGHKYTCISVSVQRATPETWGEAFQPSHPAA